MCDMMAAAAGSGKASPFGKAAGAARPFGAPTGSKSPGGPGNPFNGAGGQKLFSEYDGRLSPTMEPDEFEEKPWWQQISLGQVVRALPVCLLARIPLVRACSNAQLTNLILIWTSSSAAPHAQSAHMCRQCVTVTSSACTPPLTVHGMSVGVQLIVLSFTLIIALMIGTFTVVYKVGGIRFNE